MLRIDGTEGEGGGQILRTALGLSLVTKTPFAIDKIRQKRKKPGLHRQHLTAVLHPGMTAFQAGIAVDVGRQTQPTQLPPQQQTAAETIVRPSRPRDANGASQQQGQRAGLCRTAPWFRTATSQLTIGGRHTLALDPPIQPTQSQ